MAKKDKNTAAFISLVFGWFGMHQLYLKKPGRAIFFIAALLLIKPSLMGFFVAAMMGFVNALILMMMPQQRFDQIYNRLAHQERPVLGPDDNLPSWLLERENYSIWVRNNLWMLNNALVYGGQNVTLFALWNGEGGDGVGGTQDMVNQASSHGANVVILDTKKLFNLP